MSLESPKSCSNLLRSMTCRRNLRGWSEEPLPLRFEHHNNLHPHKVLGYRSLREFIGGPTQPQSCPIGRGATIDLGVVWHIYRMQG